MVYFAGGYQAKTTVNRLDYANDTATAPARSPLTSTGGRYMAAAGNANFGYFAGGEIPSANVSSVDRIDYSNDTAAPVTKGPLSYTGNMDAGTGNPNFGYFGRSGEAVVDRIDYSNDTATASARSSLTISLTNKCAFSARENDLTLIGPALVSNTPEPLFPITSFGYFGGGTPAQSRVDRINLIMIP